MQGRRQVKICGVDRHGEREPITGVWRRSDPRHPSRCKNSSDLYQFQERPLAKSGVDMSTPVHPVVTPLHKCCPVADVWGSNIISNRRHIMCYNCCLWRTDTCKDRQTDAGPQHRSTWGRWKCETWNCGTWKCGTMLQGWKMRETR